MHLHEMAHAFALQYREGKPQRVGPPGDYRSYYTDAHLELVHRVWKREIDLFGFAFDEPRSAYMPRALTARVKASKYVLREDRLL